GLPIRLRFAGPALVPRVMPAFAHLVSEPTPGRGDVLTVCLWDSASTRTRLPPTTLLPRVEDAPSRYLYRTGNLSFVFRASAHRSELSFHAAAVGNDGRGVLVVGPGRSGKSTTALACLAAGFDYAGDDYVVVSSEPPHVHSAYCAGKLAWSDLARHPALLPDPVEPAAAG